MINIKRNCELFEISKSSYYKFKSKKESYRIEKRKSDILEIKKYRDSTKEAKNVEGLKNELNRNFRSKKYGKK